MRIAAAAALAVLVGTGATAGRGSSTPAWSYLPSPLRAQLAAKSGGTLFLPARTPLFYRYRTGAKVTDGTLSVPFTNRVRIKAGVWRWTSATFLWQVQPLAGATRCGSWKTSEKTLQMSGNKVLWSAVDGTAWRCVTDRNGRKLVLSASAPAAPGEFGLATAVASGLDVSTRTNVRTVALTVTPSRVRHGATVLVQGVAGGCPAGDSATVISHAFTATHSFAGVPAVFAPVGSAGRFSVTTRIPATRRPGVYTLTARCGGGNLGLTARLTVVR